MGTLIGFAIIVALCAGAYYFGHSKGRLSVLESEIGDLLDKIKAKL